MEGHPDNVAAALLGGIVLCSAGERGAARAAAGPGGAARGARRARAHDQGPPGAALADPDGGRRVQRRPRRACCCSASSAATSGWSRAGSATGCTSRAGRTSIPRSWELVGRARALGALGATISGAGPTVLVWCELGSTGTVFARLPPRPTDGRGCCACRSRRRARTSASYDAATRRMVATSSPSSSLFCRYASAAAPQLALLHEPDVARVDDRPPPRAPRPDALQQRVVARQAHRVQQHDVRGRAAQGGQRVVGRVGGAHVLDVRVLGEPERDEPGERLRVVAVEDADSHTSDHFRARCASARPTRPRTSRASAR